MFKLISKVTEAGVGNINLIPFLPINTGQSRNDGWVVATELGSDRVAVTTRDTGDCPNGITVGYNLNRATDYSFRIACEGDLSNQGSLPQEDGEDETTLIEDDPYSAGVTFQDDDDAILSDGYPADRPYIPAVFDKPRDPRDTYCDDVLKQCLCGECDGGRNGKVVGGGGGSGYLQPRGK